MFYEIRRICGFASYEMQARTKTHSAALQLMESRYPFLKGAVIRKSALFQHISRVVEMASNILRAVCIGADCDDLTAFFAVLTDEFGAGMLLL